jgi:hypothetical protein
MLYEGAGAIRSKVLAMLFCISVNSYSGAHSQVETGKRIQKFVPVDGYGKR